MFLLTWSGKESITDPQESSKLRAKILPSPQPDVALTLLYVIAHLQGFVIMATQICGTHIPNAVLYYPRGICLEVPKIRGPAISTPSTGSSSLDKPLPNACAQGPWRVLLWHCSNKWV